MQDPAAVFDNTLSSTYMMRPDSSYKESSRGHALDTGQRRGRPPASRRPDSNIHGRVVVNVHVFGTRNVGLIRSTPLIGLSAFAAAFALMSPVVSFAQPAVPPATPAPPSSNLDVPTTKILAIGRFTAKGTPDKWKPLLPAEVRDTVRLYLAGKIDQWYLKQDQSGVVFMMNVTDPKEALALLGMFPFGRAGLMEFEIIPLGPIAPLRVLLTDSAK